MDALKGMLVTSARLKRALWKVLLGRVCEFVLGVENLVIFGLDKALPRLHQYLVSLGKIRPKKG